VVALAFGIAIFAAQPATAATQIGATFPPSNGLASITLIPALAPANEYTVPFDGVITSWSHEGGGASPPDALIKLKVARPAGGTDFTIVGESVFKNPVPGQLNTYNDVRIPVRAGDVIGIYNATAGTLLTRDTPGFGYFFAIGGEPLQGSTSTYSGPTANRQLDLAAQLEPDCDSDGFGDETQDGELLACPPAPTAAITKAPADKVKTKKKSVSVSFEFNSDDPGATFNCTLDGQQEFKACTSPLTVSVKKGEHTFSVTAADGGGNQSAAATDTFKVKRKKKKKK
jgi:hypothetical protein